MATPSGGTAPMASPSNTSPSASTSSAGARPPTSPRHGAPVAPTAPAPAPPAALIAAPGRPRRRARPGRRCGGPGRSWRAPPTACCGSGWPVGRGRPPTCAAGSITQMLAGAPGSMRPALVAALVGARARRSGRTPRQQGQDVLGRHARRRGGRPSACAPGRRARCHGRRARRGHRQRRLQAEHARGAASRVPSLRSGGWGAWSVATASTVPVAQRGTQGVHVGSRSAAAD